MEAHATPGASNSTPRSQGCADSLIRRTGKGVEGLEVVDQIVDFIGTEFPEMEIASKQPSYPEIEGGSQLGGGR